MAFPQPSVETKAPRPKSATPAPRRRRFVPRLPRLPFRRGLGAAAGGDLAALPARRLERYLLLWNLLPFLLGALAVAVTAPGGFREGLRGALAVLLPIYGGCLGLHLLLSLLRFEGDAVLLPVLSLLFGVGGIYHLGIRRPGSGVTADAYLVAVLVGLAAIALLVAAARPLRRLALGFEEKVWWPIAGDRPYYGSTPFHALLLGGMAALVLWLRVFGRTEGDWGDAIVQVPLPGGWTFTPSEFVRLAVAFFLAEYLAANSKVLRNLRQPLGRRFPFNQIHVEHKPELVVVLTMLLLYGAFFYLFRDFGPAVIIFLLTLLCLLAATGRAPTPLALLGIAGLVVALPAYLGWGFRTLHTRVAMWLHPWSTDFPNGDHLARALWGVASGGWFGIGVGTVNLHGLLPEAARDTVFAGVATTMGFWVAAVVLGLYAALATRGYQIARAAPTDHGRMLAFSLTSLLALQAIWICAASVRVLPLSGINLPFLSTGISSMIASCIPVAVLLGLSKAPAMEEATTDDRRPGGRPIDTTDDRRPTTVLRGVTRFGRPVVAAFLLPFLGLAAYAIPFVLGDRTLTRPARAVGRKGEAAEFTNPYLARFRAQFARGRVFTVDGKLLAGAPSARAERRVPSAEPRPGTRHPAPGTASGASAERRYPLRSATAQLVGWTTGGRFAPGSESVETLYDSELRGYRNEDLPRLFRGRHNPFLPKPKPHDISLTIRADLQEYAARRLRQTVRQWGGSGGAALLYDAGSGAVLAAATAPSFDPNGMTLARMQELSRRHAQSQILTNKALSRDALFFPGSTFKLLTAAAALSAPVEGYAACRSANGQDLTWSYNGIRYRRRVGAIHDYGDASHGTLSLDDGMEWGLTVSCNVFFATLATRIGPERLSRTLREAGLSVAPAPDKLAPYLAEAGFGQVAVKVAPVEMARLVGAIGRANGGGPVAAEPYWIEKIEVGPRQPVLRPWGRVGSPATKLYRPLTPDVARRLREMMLQVVNHSSGTAYRAFHDTAGAPWLPHLEIGGKTGTAEFDRLIRARSGRRVPVRRKHAWFVGFAQDPSRLPRRTLAVAVLVEDVRGRATGGTVCAPLARDLIARVLPPVDGQVRTPSRDRDWFGNFLDRVDQGVETLRRLRGMIRP